MTDNLRFYTPGAKVPKEACKEFNNGRFKGTDINRMWRVRTLTQMFGPCGFGWTFQLVDIQERNLDGSDAVVLYARGILRVKDPDTSEWSEPIIGYGGNFLVQSFSSGSRLNDEAYKMVETDAFGAACSKLGIGESVYWNEASKYTQQNQSNEEPKKKAARTDSHPARPTSDPFFGSKTTADNSTSEKSQSAAVPTDKEIMETIYAVKDPATKAAMSAYMNDHNIMSPYETTPEQRKALYDIAKGVIA